VLWTTLKRLSLAGLTLIGVISFCSLDFDYAESSASFEPGQLNVAIGRTWHSRTLTVANAAGERVGADLMKEWGPELRTNMYQTSQDELGILDFGGAWRVLHSPLRLEQTRPSNDWEYLGTFLRGGYRAAQDEDECMDILLDEPPPPIRSWVYRERC